MSVSKTLSHTRLTLIAACSAALVACGGGASKSTSAPSPAPAPSPSPSPSPSPAPAPAPAAANPAAMAPCLPSGSGIDYQVGSGAGQLASINLVPWERLAAGDTVRIFYSATPYRGHILLAARGTAQAPVRVCGVKGPNGERPIIDGQNAVVRSGLSYGYAIQETRAIVMVDRLGTEDWGTAYPTHIQIDGLEIRAQHPSYTFTNSAGVTQAYETFGACIWVDRGKNITIADNVLHDCTNGLFSKSVDIGAGTATITEDLRVVGNYIYGNGIVGDDHIHNIYTQSVRSTFEFNRIGPQRAGANGDALKDRSVATVVRYNHILEGAHSIDLVEAEDFPTTAMANPAYRSAFVYGNIITKTGTTGSAIHYGGDHFYSTPDGNYGEPFFRRGTLYFYSNTVNITGTSGLYDSPVIFQLSTTLESAQVWNNVFIFASTIAAPSLRAAWDSVNPDYWTAGGTFVLGKNWVPSNFVDATSGRTVPDTVTGWANLIRGSASPVDGTTGVPLNGSAIIDAAQADLAAVSAYPVLYQFDLATLSGKARTQQGTGNDLGGVERSN